MDERGLKQIYGGSTVKRYTIDKSILTLLENSCIPYAVFHMVENRIEALIVSEGLLDLFKLDRATAYDELNNHIYDRDHPDDVARLGNATRRFATEGGELDVIYRSLIDGSYRIIHIRGKHVYTESDEELAIVWYSDEGPYVDDLKDLYDQAMEHALTKTGETGVSDYDGLTGLPSVNYFFKLAEDARDRILDDGDDPVLLYFDFNDMKNYNMKFGFSQGDKLLVGMSKILVSYFSNINCCRFGGDHFVAVTRDVDLEKTLLELFEDCSKLNDGRSLPLRVGIYKNSMGLVTSGVACDRAKMACDAKRNAVSSCFNYFTDTLLKSEKLRHYLIDNLDKAIRENWLTVYYQPIIRSSNGSVCDEEALVRWIDPVRGFMSPADFVPVLEESKLIYKVDLYVLDRIIEKLKTFEEKGLYVVPCSLNVSRSDFEMCDIVEEIRRRIDEAGIDHEKLTIEITESDVGADVDYIKDQVELLEGMGFKVWMDDYGSGYSSPGVMTRIPFHTIKLDMMFLRQFDSSPKSRVIISETINMALNLGMETVVEGVETAEMAEFLREVGATKLQGYYFSKPVPQEEVLRRYGEGSGLGFEDPKESDYYSAIGRVNLYDVTLSSAENDEKEDLLNVMSVAIFEVDEERVRVIRANQGAVTGLKDHFGIMDIQTDDHDHFLPVKNEYFESFVDSLRRSSQSSNQIIEDKKMIGGYTGHILFKKIADNPVNGRKAVVAIGLEIRKDLEAIESLTFGSIARALSSDYLNLYYVDINTDDFVEYRPDEISGGVSVERRGKDFFENSRKDAYFLVHEDDREGFINTFSKEIVLDSIEKFGTFTYTYRLKKKDGFLYVHMKATMMGDKKDHIIIGINNVDARLRQKEDIERLREETLAFSRINALAREYIGFYTVDPDTENYMQFNASEEIKTLDTPKEGNRFFARAREDAKRIIFEEDVDMFVKTFTKENVVKSINDTGAFSIIYRLKLGEDSRYVCLKGVRFNENGKDRLIFGISDMKKRDRV